MNIVTTIAPIALALIMLGLGLGLTVQDFKRVVTSPRDFATGIICQIIILPIIPLKIKNIKNIPIPINI